MLSHVWWLVWFLDLFAPVVLRTAPPVVRGVWCVVYRVVGSCVVFGDPLEALLEASWAILGRSWGPPGPSWSAGKPRRLEPQKLLKTIQKNNDFCLVGPSGEAFWGILEANWHQKVGALIPTAPLRAQKVAS